MLVPVVDGGFGGSDGFGHGQFWVGCARRDDGKASPHRAVIEAGIEDGGAQSLGCDAVAVSFRDALGETTEAQPTQVVGDASRSQLAGLFPQQWSKMLAYTLVGKCALHEKEQSHDVQDILTPGSSQP